MFAQPNDWTFHCQRDDIAPDYRIDTDVTFQGHPTLILAGQGKEHANGHWTKTVLVESGQCYNFQVYYKALNVEEPHRCILARIIWLDTDGKQIGRAEYPAIKKAKTTNGWSSIQQTYAAPKMTASARIELTYRWDPDGLVRYGGFAFQKSKNPEPRMVRLASVFHQPKNSAGTHQNLEEFEPFIKEAAKQGADIVCLPEGITLVGTDLNYVEASEPVPGPTTDFLGKIAYALNIYIVAGLLERSGEAVYNTAVLIDRKGNLAGKYRKVCLPREEIEGGVTPGNELPVFETDFGTIGMMICWDVTFPEVSRTLAQKGAEVIFLPIWGGNLTLTQARAIENQVYIVSSSYSMKTGIFDLEGKLIREASPENRVIVADVDLNQQKLWPWLGDLKNRIPREMPSEKALKVEN
jgi:predicted amidohydrolase